MEDLEAHSPSRRSPQEVVKDWLAMPPEYRTNVPWMAIIQAADAQTARALTQEEVEAWREEFQSGRALGNYAPLNPNPEFQS